MVVSVTARWLTTAHDLYSSHECYKDSHDNNTDVLAIKNFRCVAQLFATFFVNRSGRPAVEFAFSPQLVRDLEYGSKWGLAHTRSLG
jgi:hypothetical protein